MLDRVIKSFIAWPEISDRVGIAEDRIQQIKSTSPVIIAGLILSK